MEIFWSILVLNSATFIVGQSSQRYYCAVTIGEDAVISAFRLVCRDFLQVWNLPFRYFSSLQPELLLVIWILLLESIDQILSLFLT